MLFKSISFVFFTSLALTTTATPVQKRQDTLNWANFCGGQSLEGGCKAYEPTPDQCVAVDPGHYESVIIAPYGWSAGDASGPLSCKIYKRSLNPTTCDDATQPKTLDTPETDDIGSDFYDDVGFFKCEIQQ